MMQDERNEPFAEIGANASSSMSMSLSYSAAPVLAPKQAMSGIPIVLRSSPDPLGSGHVASLANRR